MIEAMKQALEALETEVSIDWTNNDEFNASAEKMHDAITSLRQAIAEAEKQVTYTGNGSAGRENMTAPTGFLFQMPKREWVGLTDEEIQEIALEVPMDAVRITEAKLKEKNT